MTTRQAGIKITVDNGSALSALDGLGKKARTVGASIKDGLKAGFKDFGGEALKGGGGALRDLAGGLKNAIGTAATLGGGVGFGMLVKKASDLREKYRDIEFQVNKTGKATADWEGIMGLVQDAAADTGKSSEEMAGILEGLFASTGDWEFAAGAIKQIGHASTASGQDLGKLADAAQMLRRKFGASIDELPDMLGVFVEKSDAGGLSLDSLGNKFALMAGEAAEAGFQGKDGLSALLGIMTELDARVGEKAEPAMKKLFQILKTGSKDLKAFSKESGVKFSADMTAVEKMRAILSSDKGRAKMTEKLGGESRVVFDELSKPFTEAAAAAKAEGKNAKDQTKAGLAAFDESMARMGKSTIDYARLVEESKAGQKEDPQAKLNAAIEKISRKFTEPKMLEALDNLAEALPKVADAMIKMLDFAVKHPVLAGGAVLGAKVGGGMLGAGAGKLAENVGGMIKDALLGTGTKVGTDAAGALQASAPSLGKQIGTSLGIAGAAIIAYQVGKALIDARIEEKEQSQRTSIGAGIEATNAINAKDKDAMMAAKEKLEADYKRQVNDYNSFTTSGLDPMMNKLAGLVDKDYKAPEITQMENTVKQLEELNAAIANLKETVGTASQASGEMAKNTTKAGQAAGQASQQLRNIAAATPTDTTGNGTSKGPGGVGNKSTPGYAAGG